MGAIFTSPGRTVGAGVVLLIAIVVVVGLVTGQMTKIDHAWATFVMRWLHVISGVFWIGLLWYLNFVQVPTMPTIQPVESRTAITKFIAPNVLFYFRYAALATVITGLLLAWMLGQLPGARPEQAVEIAPDLLPQVSSAPGYLDVLANSLNIMQDHITRTRLAGEPPDVLLVPRLANIGLMEFTKARQAIAEGRHCVQHALPLLKRYV